MTTTYTRDQINALLLANDKAVLVAMTRLYAAQTADEQAVTTVRHLNHKGFSVRTVGIGSRIARKVNKGVTLSAYEMKMARDIALWHSKQLVELANAKAAAKAATVAA